MVYAFHITVRHKLFIIEKTVWVFASESRRDNGEMRAPVPSFFSSIE